MRKRVVVTGGAGFIGSNLSIELARRGYEVVIFDDLSTGKMKNIEPLLKSADVKFIQDTITDLSILQKSFREVDYVFHQAAIPSVPRSIKNPRASHEANVTGTLNVLLAAQNNDVKKVVFASSSSVYGDTPTLPKSEDMSPKPMSPYSVTKLTGEYYCQVFKDIYHVPTICLRYFNVYGPHQDSESQYAAVIPKFIKSIQEGQSPTIFGDGEQTRDFTFVRDVVQANILAAESKVTGVFNIARGERISINHLLQLICGLLGKHVEPVYESSMPGDVRHSLADVSKAGSFGYHPEWRLDDGIKETIHSFVS